MSNLHNDSLTQVDLDRATFVRDALTDLDQVVVERKFRAQPLWLFAPILITAILAISAAAAWWVLLLIAAGAALLAVEAFPLAWAETERSLRDPEKVRALHEWSLSGSFPRSYVDPPGDFTWGGQMRRASQEFEHRQHVLRLELAAAFRSSLVGLDVDRARELVSDPVPRSAHDRHMDGLKAADPRDIDTIFQAMVRNYDS